MLWPQALLVLLGVHSLQCSGFLDETLIAETMGEAIKLDEMQEHQKHHHRGRNHPHVHNKHHEHKKGETTCSCNQNVCVTTSYMCRTNLEGGCYFVRNETATAYGCIDQLTDVERRNCKYHQSLLATKGLVELSCCMGDMCNYRITTDSSSSSEPIESRGESPSYYDDFWITVMLIAVPTCGMLIMLVLVLMAWKILQRDSKYDAHLRSSSGYMQCHAEQNSANRHSKARLLLLEDGSLPSDKVVKNAIYKGPQDKVTNWVLASPHGEKPSAV
ncbi:BMP and activin membrane-bound inhibitor homolog isoform X1 [Cloeon dipterum]|uniref:BMP and activin membrane-bound inhibitor homolog isoform X1 n=1 Tax=Cloeon dipterum TaxID=197152 RepID=UPI0032206F20